MFHPHPSRVQFALKAPTIPAELSAGSPGPWPVGTSFCVSLRAHHYRGLESPSSLPITLTAAIKDPLCDLSQIFILSHHRKNRGSRYPVTFFSALVKYEKGKMC